MRTSYLSIACLFLCLRVSMLDGVMVTALKNAIISSQEPFAYPLQLTIYEAEKSDAEVMVYLHGSGSSIQEAAYVHKRRSTPYHTVAFNFPDARVFDQENFDPKKTSFGTIHELLPALYVIKQCVINAGLNKLHLCGFSAGGAAIINLLGVLNQGCYDDQLATIGIASEDKSRLLAALQEGHIILNCPLKSIEEIIAARGDSLFLRTLAQRYAANGFCPLDTVSYLAGLKLFVVLHFQEDDEILSNRDDQLFYTQLKNVIESSQGKLVYLRGNDGGHNVYHTSLWREYAKINK